MADSSLGRSLVLGLMALGLAGIFVWSFVYRAEHPSLVVPLEAPGSMGQPGQGGQSAPQGMPGGAAMEDIMAAMTALKQNPDDPHAIMAAVEAFMAGEMWDKAALLLEKAEAKAPGDLEVLNASGVTLFRLGKPAEAVIKFERMLEIDPADYRAQFNLGVVFKHGLNDPAKAKAYFQKAVDNPRADPKTREEAAEELSAGR